MTDLVRIDEFQRHTLATDQNALLGMDGLRFPLLGLFGEVGSLLSALKKKQRDQVHSVALLIRNDLEVGVPLLVQSRMRPPQNGDVDPPELEGTKLRSDVVSQNAFRPNGSNQLG